MIPTLIDRHPCARRCSGGCAAGERCGDAQHAPATRADRGIEGRTSARYGVFPPGTRRGWDSLGQQAADDPEPGTAAAVGKKAVVADAMEAVGQAMQQEAPDELAGVECRQPCCIAMPVIAPVEGDAGLVGADQPAVGDGDAVRIAAEVGKNMLGRAERRLGIDDPAPAALELQRTGEGRGIAQAGERSEERQLAWACAVSSRSRNSHRNSRERTWTGRKQRGRQ